MKPIKKKDLVTTETGTYKVIEIISPRFGLFYNSRGVQVEPVYINGTLITEPAYLVQTIKGKLVEHFIQKEDIK